MVTQITRGQITWSFAQPYLAGQFCNGDWWVKGNPVVIVGIDPPSNDVAGRIANGSMPTNDLQGFDNAARWLTYSAPLNVAFDVSPSNPLVITPDSSLISTVSVAGVSQRPQLEEAQILTVLSGEPAEGSFRPAPANPDRTPQFTASQLDYSILQNNAATGDFPGMATIEAYFDYPWLDCGAGFSWNEDFHPSNNMPWYGADIASLTGEGGVALNFDFPVNEKRTLYTRLVQIGIDNWGAIQGGGTNLWMSNGGQGSGRKFPIILAGMALDYEPMRDIGLDNPDPTDIWFGEDMQTFVVEETSPGVYNFGFGGYGAGDVGLAEWGIRHAIEPELDDITWAASYRTCCTATGWPGIVLAMHMMGGVSLWNHQSLFDYQDRYMDNMVGDAFRSLSDFVETAWDTYRAGL
jgi:hypothetical protein